jgi:isopentenyl-diphosphate delta-isomerase
LDEANGPSEPCELALSAPGKAGEIDRVDPQDRAVGTVRRGDALAAGANFRTVHVFVFDTAHQLLLQRLAPSRERHPERWGSSVAAYLHAGETYRAAGQRRLSEELAIEGARLAFVGKTRMRDVRSLKFVSLFTLVSDDARLADRQHIAALDYWEIPDLEQAIVTAPDMFTPTFVHVFNHFLERGGP